MNRRQMLTALVAGTALTSVTGRVRSPQAVSDALARGGPLKGTFRPVIIGERPGEAFIPLPDGRKIPVMIKGDRLVRVKT